MLSTIPKIGEQIFIDGVVGKLDCLRLQSNSKIIHGVAIIFHPDPKGGGSYTNKIVQTIAKVLLNKGYICYCPNLRGVGLSDGVHDCGIGEIDDAVAIYEYIHKLYPDYKLILAGFSFGSFIANSLAKIVKKYNHLILIGPGVIRHNFQAPDDINKTIVIHGDEDEITPFSEVLSWAKMHDQPVICYPNSGHFFHGKLLGLQSILNNLILL